ncbi:hypothetical protein A176_004165 [Myxococcus hansupus]|uniref:Uncharacterized protein n=1 Tax=Pseudomyxococcus hansupus TaxID=1297742 RepID=A0A0H4X063_9BACT|nr:hypothetical protein A176_004165 [Myxococcus hansupus]
MSSGGHGALLPYAPGKRRATTIRAHRRAAGGQRAHGDTPSVPGKTSMTTALPRAREIPPTFAPALPLNRNTAHAFDMQT